MDIEKLLRKECLEVHADESEIQAVVEAAKKTFLKREQACLLSYREFMWNQLHMIRKRWWGLQFILLCFALQFLANEQELFYMRRGMGVFATLFVVLLIPELWKNLTNRCIEIEITTYYSLHQIYATRLMLFGAVDIFLLTLFGTGVYFVLQISIVNLITQFLLPMVVTAWICFVVLGKQCRNSGIAIGLCIIWSAIWWIIASNDYLYNAVTIPLWMAVFAGVCLLLFSAVYRVLKRCDKYMEVSMNGTVFE